MTERFPLAVAGVALAVAACGASSQDRLGVPLHKPVHERQLRAISVSSLLFPGSRVVRLIGSDETPQGADHEPDPAFAGSIATAATTPEALLAWYSAQLARRGYRAARYYPQSTQSTGRAWTIPGTREQVQVGIYRSPRDVGAAPSPDSSAYEVILVSYRTTGPPPG